MMNLLDQLSSNKSSSSNIKSTIYTIADEIQNLRKSVSHSQRASSKQVPLDIINDSEKLKKFIKDSQIQELQNDSALRDLTFPLRFCIHPYQVYSQRSVCTKAYWAYDKDTLNICNQTYCATCCDMSKDIIVSMVDKSPIQGNLITETKFTKFDIAEQQASTENIHKCKEKCKEQYSFERLFKSNTLNISSLGKSKLNPALSCVDIKTYGAPVSQNGVQSVTLGGKGFQVQCDMDSGKGGWLKVLNYKSMNDIEISDNTSFPINSNVNQQVKLGNFGIKANQIKAVRFSCTMNSSPYQGIHFETNNDKIKELVANNFMKESDGSELLKRTDFPFPPDFLDLKMAIRNSDEVKLSETSGIQLNGKKLFVNSNNNNIGWGINIEQEFEGKLSKISMCGEVSKQKKDAKWVDQETVHEIFVLMHKPEQNYAFERQFKFISKSKK